MEQKKNTESDNEMAAIWGVLEQHLNDKNKTSLTEISKYFPLFSEEREPHIDLEELADEFYHRFVMTEPIVVYDMDPTIQGAAVIKVIPPLMHKLKLLDDVVKSDILNMFNAACTSPIQNPLDPRFYASGQALVELTKKNLRINPEPAKPSVEEQTSVDDDIEW